MKRCCYLFLLLLVVQTDGYSQYGHWVSPGPVNATDGIQLPSGTLLVASDRLIFRSSNNGTSWQKIALANDTDDSYFSVGAGAVVVRNARSTDDGLTWSPLTQRFTSIVCDSDGVLYGLQWQSKRYHVLTSRDGGANWSTFIDTTLMGVINAIEVGGRSWLFGYDSTYGMVRWASTQWVPVFRDSLGSSKILALGGPVFLAHGASGHLSVDSCKTWRAHWPSGNFMAAAGTKILFGMGRQIFAAQDTSHTEPLVLQDRIVSFHSLPQGNVLVGTKQGLCIADSALNSVTLLGELPGGRWMMKGPDSKLYSRGGGYDPAPSFAFSTNEGLSWQLGSQPSLWYVDSTGFLYSTGSRSLTVSSSWDTIVPNDWSITGALPDGRIVARSMDSQYHQSSDHGDTWTSLTWIPDQWNPRVDAVVGPMWYTAAYHGDIYESSNHGRSWSLMPGLPDTATAFAELLATQNGYLFLTRKGGVYRSTDGGANWKLLDIVAPESPARAADLLPFYVGAPSLAESNGWIYTRHGLASSDYGITWHALPAEYDTDFYCILALASGRVVGLGAHSFEWLEDTPPASVSTVGTPHDSLHVTPNPASTTITISMPSLQGHPIDLMIFDAAGRLTKTMYLDSKGPSIVVDVGDLPSGTYLLRCNDPDLHGYFVVRH